jgi:four helix bundle protein
MSSTHTPVFGFQRLRVYGRGIAFVAKAIPLVDRLPRGYSTLADQLRRAVTSIPLNIAEATGRFGRDAAHFFAIARGSALEAAAVLDVVEILVPDERQQIADAREELVNVVNVLTALIRTHSQGRRQE